MTRIEQRDWKNICKHREKQASDNQTSDRKPSRLPCNLTEWIWIDKGRGSKVSRSGEKGRTASLRLVGESRFLYVRTKGNIAEALSYNLLMYRGEHIGKREFICQSISMEKFGIQVLRFTNKGILSNLYGVCEYIDFVVKNRLKKASRPLKSTTTRHFPTDLHRGFYFPPDKVCSFYPFSSFQRAKRAACFR